MKKIQKNSYTIQHKMRATKAMLFLLNRCQEQNRLIAWAKNKKHSRWPQNYFYIQKNYKEQRERTLWKITLFRTRFPSQYWLARILHGISNLSSPNPAYYAGSAFAYGKQKRRR